MTVSPLDGKLYVSDHQMRRILRVKTMGPVRDLTRNYEVLRAVIFLHPLNTLPTPPYLWDHTPSPSPQHLRARKLYTATCLIYLKHV